MQRYVFFLYGVGCHLLFAVVLTGYMGLAALLEERDLVSHFGEQYENYRRRVPMFVPRLGASASPSRMSRESEPGAQPVISEARNA